MAKTLQPGTFAIVLCGLYKFESIELTNSERSVNRSWVR